MRGLFFIKKLILWLLVCGLVFAQTGCNKNTVPGGELVVVEDTSDIRLGVYGIDTLNPIATRSESVSKVMNIIYEPLFSLDENMNAVPVLASGYSMAEDGQSITVSLKDGIKWQDGTNFTADDVVHTLSRMCSSDGLYYGISSMIKSFTAVNKKCVLINLESCEPDFVYCLTFPIISVNTEYRTDNTFIPMGTGPYKFKGMDNSQILLEPNSAWHGGSSSEKNIIVRVLKDKQAVCDAFSVNEIDAVTSDELDVEASAPNGNSQFKTVISDNLVFLGFNTQKEPIASVNIRKAISLLLDKQKIVDNYAYGYGQVTDLPINPNSWAYPKNLKKASGDDAEKLISQEGYIKNEGVYYKDGVPLECTILVNEDNQKRVAMAEAICEELRSYGFYVSSCAVTFDEYNSKIDARDFDMFLGEITVPPNLNPAVMLDGDNYFDFDTQVLNKTISELKTGVSKQDYVRLVETFLRIFNENPPYIPLYFKTKSVIYASYVSGIKQPVLSDFYTGIEKWYFYANQGKSEQAD